MDIGPSKGTSNGLKVNDEFFVYFSWLHFGPWHTAHSFKDKFTMIVLPNFQQFTWSSFSCCLCFDCLCVNLLFYHFVSTNFFPKLSEQVGQWYFLAMQKTDETANTGKRIYAHRESNLSFYYRLFCVAWNGPQKFTHETEFPIEIEQNRLSFLLPATIWSNKKYGLLYLCVSVCVYVYLFFFVSLSCKQRVNRFSNYSHLFTVDCRLADHDRILSRETQSRLKKAKTKCLMWIIMCDQLIIIQSCTSVQPNECNVRNSD